jgi:hypothetical protein
MPCSNEQSSVNLLDSDDDSNKNKENKEMGEQTKLQGFQSKQDQT